LRPVKGAQHHTQNNATKQHRNKLHPAADTHSLNYVSGSTYRPRVSVNALLQSSLLVLATQSAAGSAVICTACAIKPLAAMADACPVKRNHLTVDWQLPILSAHAWCNTAAAAAAAVREAVCPAGTKCTTSRSKTAEDNRLCT
jgi:hypothetical protein